MILEKGYKEFYEKLNKLQTRYKAPKGQYNAFGKYKYRSHEDQLEGLKPLLKELRLILNISDEVIQLGDRFYIKAIVTLSDVDSENFMQSKAFARESESKKGMDESQITGTASSYARKYAMNGLLAIDDTKDADTMDNSKDVKNTDTIINKPTVKLISDKQIGLIKSLSNGKEKMLDDHLKKTYNKKLEELNNDEFQEILGKFKKK